LAADISKFGGAWDLIRIQASFAQSFSWACLAGGIPSVAWIA